MPLLNQCFFCEIKIKPNELFEIKKKERTNERTIENEQFYGEFLFSPSFSPSIFPLGAISNL